MKLSTLHKLKSKIFNESIKSIIEKNEIFEVTFQNDVKVFIRNESHSDSSVFHQIFVFKEYELVQKIMTLNTQFAKQKNIIDAGANVGYTTVYFANIFDNSRIFAVEPSHENAQMFDRNIANLKNKDKIKLYQRALSHKPNLTFEIDRNFRDGKDWSIATNETINGKIEGISVNEIINENNLSHISLLKIDIEGAERFIFRMENDLSFLKITEIIALEIHDEFEIRNLVNEILVTNNFLILESGELTIGINTNLNNAI